MKKKIYIICAFFILISSCKYNANNKDLKNLEQNVKGKVKGFLDIKKGELIGGLKKLGGEASLKVEEELMQGDYSNNILFNPPTTLLASHHDNVPVLKMAQSGDQQEVKKEDKEKEEIEKKNRELKDKIEKSNKKTSIETYLKYEEEIKKIVEELEEKLKDKKEDKEKLEKELETLKKTLKEKIEKRKKELENAQKKFAEFEKQFTGITGVTDGDKAQNRGKVGRQAWTEAQELGLSVNSSGGSAGTGDMAKGIIDGVLKQIEEELKKVENKKE
ncbi:hypothetical protein [Borreliella valaisiana]|uniref:Uncharacterized protein n=1 Tax=Borreliella valaisiana VS116 TaxID=445987 RepID=C0R9G0_BORVA|nr:hypothetical protein [Borreliella valaisiana]ACN53087.1 hypothetical protein BVAVS116_V0037 [Borreliella valaisiana VS116]